MNIRTLPAARWSAVGALAVLPLLPLPRDAEAQASFECRRVNGESFGMGSAEFYAAQQAWAEEGPLGYVAPGQGRLPEPRPLTAEAQQILDSAWEQVRPSVEAWVQRLYDTPEEFDLGNAPVDVQGLVERGEWRSYLDRLWGSFALGMGWSGIYWINDRGIPEVVCGEVVPRFGLPFLIARADELDLSPLVDPAFRVAFEQRFVPAVTESGQRVKSMPSHTLGFGGAR